MKITVYCPAESTCGAINDTVKLPAVPRVGDILCAPGITPATGPGASDYTFKVTTVIWNDRGVPHINVTRQFGWDSEG